MKCRLYPSRIVPALLTAALCAVALIAALPAAAQSSTPSTAPITIVMTFPVGSAKRVALLPNVPTVAEAGIAGFNAVTWFGVVAPPKTAPEIAAKLSAAVADVLKHPDVIKRLQDLSAEPVGGTPAETAAFMKDEAERWKRVIQSANVKVD